MTRWATLDDGGGNVITLTSDPSDGVLVELVGWYGGYGVRTSRTERLGDGSFPSRLRREGRKLTLKGLVRQADSLATERFERMLSGMFPYEDSKGTLRADYGSGALTAEKVELDGEPRIAANLEDCWVNFEVPLFAPDPNLYGETKQTGSQTSAVGQGLVFPLFDNESAVTTGFLEFAGANTSQASTLTNDGNAIAYPVVIVSGEFPSGFVLTLSGDGPEKWGVTYVSAVRTPSPVTVDFSGSLTVNGFDQSQMLTERNWGGVRPGGQVTVSVEPVSGGAGSAQLILRSTFR